MKQTIITALLLAASLSARASVGMEDELVSDLKGNVKSAEVFAISQEVNRSFLFWKKTVEKRTKSYSYLFCSPQFACQKARYGTDGELFMEEKCQPDEDGWRCEKFSKGNKTESVVVRNNGDLQTTLYYDRNGALFRKELRKFDSSKAILVQEEQFWADGTKDYSSTYRYDEKNRRVEHLHYFGSGMLKDRETWKYDERGNVVEHCLFNADGGLLKKSSFEYGAGGVLQSERVEEKGKRAQTSYISFVFDDHGNWIEKRWGEKPNGKGTKGYARVLKYE